MYKIRCFFFGSKINKSIISVRLWVLLPVGSEWERKEPSFIHEFIELQILTRSPSTYVPTYLFINT